VINERRERSDADRFCTRCDLRSEMLLDTTRAELVCPSCGVARSAPFIGEIPLDMGMARSSRASIYKRETYFRERLSQFTCSEPRVYAKQRRSIVEADQRLRTRLGDAWPRGRLFKDDVKMVLHEAGLSVKKFWEKSNSINELLRPGTTPLRPSPDTIEQFEKWFSSISTAWSKAPLYVKQAPGRSKPRRHIISVDFIMHQLLLRVGMEAYLFYRDEFPLTNLRRTESLQATVGYMCRLCQSTLTSELARVPTYRLRAVERPAPATTATTCPPETASSQ